MELDTQTLKEARLGPIVLFYTKTRRVTPGINRQADALVQAWSRPIIKRPANLRSRYVETVDEAVENAQRQRERDREGDEGDEDMDDSTKPAIAMKRKRFDARAALQETVGRKGARIFINRVSRYDLRWTSADGNRTCSIPSRQTRKCSIRMRISRMCRGYKWTTRSSTSLLDR